MKIIILKFMNRYVYLVCLICLNFIQAQNIKQGSSVLVDGIFAIIGDHVIFHSDINNQINQYQTQGFDDPNLREKVIEELFFQKTLLHFAAVDSLIIDPAEIDNTLNQRILFFEEQLGSKEKVESYFKKSIIELKDELKPIVEDQLLIQKMQYEIIKNIDVSPLEIETFYNDLHVDSIPLIETQFQIAQILKKPDASNLAIEETLSKLEDLRNRILKGADFSTMAILYSEDPGSSRNGGGYFDIKKGFFVKEFEAVAFSLDIDEVSEVFETQFGYHIVQLIDRRGNEIDVRHILMTPKISNNDMIVAKEFLEALKNKIIDNTMSFSEAAKEFSADDNTKYNGGVLINPNKNNSFFSISELEKLDISLLNEIKDLSVDSLTAPMYIKLPDGQEAYRIIKLISKTNEHVANLKDDYPFLKNLYSQIKEDRELKKWYKRKIQDVYVHTYENMYNYNFYNNLLSHE
ncbi:MAG: hypothetical protein CMP62_02750 [Flavobacteriales bacterium]|nr:hypothetical protein [Flavobacteriales bacterium]